MVRLVVGLVVLDVVGLVVRLDVGLVVWVVEGVVVAVVVREVVSEDVGVVVCVVVRLVVGVLVDEDVGVDVMVVVGDVVSVDVTVVVSVVISQLANVPESINEYSALFTFFTAVSQVASLLPMAMTFPIDAFSCGCTSPREYSTIIASSSLPAAKSVAKSASTSKPATVVHLTCGASAALPL